MKRRNFRLNGQPLIMIIPMIDIMLFLLVFFMIGTIYMVQTSNFDVSLPQSQLPKQEANPNVIKIIVRSDGTILYDGDKVFNKQLAQKTRETLAADKDTVFVLFGDKSVDYGQVVNVLAVLKKNGVKKISMATEVKAQTK